MATRTPRTPRTAPGYAPADPSDGREAERTYHHGDLRAALLAAAEAELIEHGLAGFSLRSTARRANVSHGAPAHHFASADLLLSALAEVGFERLGDAVAHGMAQAGAAPAPRLAAAGRAYVGFARAHAALFRLMFFGQRARQVAAGQAPAGVASARAFGLLRSAVQAALGPDAGETAIAVGIAASWGLVHGISHLLIEDAAGFLEPFGAAQRQAIVEQAIDRLALAVGAG